MDLSDVFTTLTSAITLSKKLLEIAKNNPDKALYDELFDKLTSAKFRMYELRDQIEEQERRLNHVENWNEEKVNYRLHHVALNNYSYIRYDSEAKENGTGLQLCANCFENRKKSVLNFSKIAGETLVSCPNCQSKFKARV